MKGSFYEEIKNEVLKDIEKVYAPKFGILEEKIGDLKQRGKTALIITSLVASLMGIGSGMLYSTHNDKKQDEMLEEKMLEQKLIIMDMDKMPALTMMQIRMQEMQKGLDKANEE